MNDLKNLKVSRKLHKRLKNYCFDKGWKIGVFAEEILSREMDKKEKKK